MTDPSTPQPQPEPQVPHSLAYESAPEYRNAPTLVTLATVFNFIAAGFDAVYALFMLGMAALVFAADTPPPASRPSPLSPPYVTWMVASVYGVPALLTMAAAVVKFIGTFRLKQRKNAWGWGLAVGILGCLQLWMFFPCCMPVIIPLATGVYTVVVMCLPQVRAYLLNPGAQ